MGNGNLGYVFDLIINEAWKYQFLTYPNPAVGAAVIVNNRIFTGVHKKAGGAHAEVNALWSAFEAFHDTPDLKTPHQIHEYLIKYHNGFFKNSNVYVTLEPCSHTGKTPSCADLLAHLKPKSVTIGWPDPIKGHGGGAEMLKKAAIEVNIINDKRCFDLIEPFIKWQKRFVFYKLALTLNGAITGGYISSESSLKWVHKVRDKIGLLVIGGNTVRIDRPTLDARKAGGRAPDVLIYTKNGKIERNIPLFNVQKRRVFVENTLERMEGYKFIMIEGGERFYSEIKDIVDWKVFIISPKITNRFNFRGEDFFEIIHTLNGEDLIVFGR